ncbi:hypothetical protein NUSPORA_02249 [Nucleospora cyclopteri]
MILFFSFENWTFCAVSREENAIEEIQIEMHQLIPNPCVVLTSDETINKLEPKEKDGKRKNQSNNNDEIQSPPASGTTLDENSCLYPICYFLLAAGAAFNYMLEVISESMLELGEIIFCCKKDP